MARQTFVTPCPCLVTHLIKDRWPLACAVPPAPGALGTQLGPPNASVQGLQQSTHPGRDSLTYFNRRRFGTFTFPKANQRRYGGGSEQHCINI